MNRARPYPPNSLVSAPNWDVQVLEVLRGDVAWQALTTASKYNDPPPEGMEHVLVKLSARCTYDDEEEHPIRGADFDLTGSRLALYAYTSVTEPAPELDAKLYKDGETAGWVAYLVAEDETELILVVDELANWDDDSLRFIALDEGASITVDKALGKINPSEAGTTRGAPLPIGNTAVTEDWEVTVVDVMRGDKAWQAIKAANKYSDPPEEGMEYVLARIAARNISIRDAPVEIDRGRFRATGSENILHESVWVVAPQPVLDAALYPGGHAEGSLVVQVGIAESDIMLRFAPLFDFAGESRRFLALEAGASVEPSPALASLPSNEVGKSREAPAPLGETATMEEWELSVLEVLRGDEAWERVQLANRYNDAPDQAMQYVLVKLSARYIGTEEPDAHKGIREGHCQLTGTDNELRDPPSIIGRG